jgi:hypothetical protein
MQRPVDPITEDVRVLVGQGLFQITEHDAYEKVPLARLSPQAGNS